MGYTKTTYQQTVQRLSQSGSGGFWWVRKDGLGDAVQIGFSLTGFVDSANDIFGASNFKNLLGKMVTEGISIKDQALKIDSDLILTDNGIENQVNNLDAQELAQIDTDWNTQILIKRWNNPLLAIAYFRAGTFTWVGLKNRFTDMGEIGEFKRERLTILLDDLVAEGDITQNQADSYLDDWDNNPNID